MTKYCKINKISKMEITMNCDQVRTGMKVKTNTNLGDTVGMLIKQEYLNNRSPSLEGVIDGCVAGHGGDVWWVRHSETIIAAYCFNEFDPT